MMNTSFTVLPVDATSELCPIDGRRASKELYIKLFVVHFTVITAYCHLLSIRNERVVSWRPLYFFFTPFNIIAQHAAALLIIAIGYGLELLPDTLHRHHLSIQQLQSPMSWLLGDISKMTSGSQGYSALPLQSPRLVSQGTLPNRQGTSKMAGRILVILAFETQCIGAIVLYARRQKHDAVTYVDQKIFELACGGLLIGILTLCVVIRVPVFHRPVPDSRPLKLEKAIFWLRSCALLFPSPLHGDSIWENPQVWRELYKENVISFLVMIATSHFVVWVSPWKVILWNPDDAPADVVAGKYAAEQYTLLFLISCALVVVGYMGCSRLMNGSLRRIDWEEFFLGLWVISMACIIPVSVVVFRDLSHIFVQIKKLAEWPVDVACPMLWSDPYANYIWWLA